MWAVQIFMTQFQIKGWGLLQGASIFFFTNLSNFERKKKWNLYRHKIGLIHLIKEV